MMVAESVWVGLAAFAVCVAALGFVPAMWVLAEWSIHREGKPTIFDDPADYPDQTAHENAHERPKCG